jgi:helix-hairpin-helix protein
VNAVLASVSADDSAGRTLAGFLLLASWFGGTAHAFAAHRSLNALPGVSRSLASEIVRAREEIDGFSSLEGLGMALHLEGDQVEDLRPYVVFLPR